MSRKSIGERLKRAQTLDTWLEVAQDWAANWRADHEQTLARLERAVGMGRVDDAGQILGQLKALNDKAMGALPRVLDALADDTMT
ncbi:hypothetical protein [Pararhodobacter sp.]|uniref:hypothetical protein n=1 Tax=Pararhodobacter sp. TaxID=2127056 RepID=UPI002AFFC92E|nr:hypothetical protein [Pararhodobacter sp.]